MCCTFISVAFVVSAGASSSLDQDLNTWMAMTMKAATAGACQGSVAECLSGGNEFNMDSEIKRRILAASNYISYGALQRNTVPCSRQGASYYNCQPGAEANPYTRGCSALTRCRS